MLRLQPGRHGGRRPLVSSHGLPVTLLLDEFGNLGRIPHFETTISVARGQGIGIVVVAQSLGQLDGVYGRNHARTIRDDCATKITLGGGVDLETARLFAELSGETTLVIETQSRRPDRYSWFGGEEVSHSQQHVRRTLLTADEVRRLPQGSMLVVTTNRPTMVLPCFWYDAPPRPGRAAALGPEQALTVDPPRPAPPHRACHRTWTTCPARPASTTGHRRQGRPAGRLSPRARARDLPSLGRTVPLVARARARGLLCCDP